MIWKYVPERVKKWIAESFGFFWKPCPICGKMFSGFEVTKDNAFLIKRDTLTFSSADIVCNNPACRKEAERRNRRFITYLKGGVTIFLDEVDGDDNNDGLTPETPLKSMHEATSRLAERLDNSHYNAE